MAVSTINPWSSGAVVFNQQPYLAFYERQAAKKQAKEDALDNYFRDLGKNVTSTGMRSQDVPSLMGKYKEWQDFYGQNKSAILNPKLDNGKAYSEYMNRYQDQLGTISASKEALKSMDEIGKMKLNPKMSYVFDDPKFMDDVQKHELPIDDPNRVGINLATITMPPEPITTKDLDAYNKYLTGGVPFDKIPGKTEDLGGFKTRTPIHQQYSVENQRVIGDHAMNAYDTDKRWRREAVKVFEELKHDPVKYEEYNKVFKSLYGGDIDDPKEAWAAKGILDNNMRATEYKEGKDEIGLWNYKEKIRQANAEELIRLRKRIDPSDQQLNDLWVTSYVDRLKEDALNRRPTPYKYANGSVVEEYDIPIDPVLGKALSVGNVEPDAAKGILDNNMRATEYKEGKDEI